MGSPRGTLTARNQQSCYLCIARKATPGIRSSHLAFSYKKDIELPVSTAARHEAFTIIEGAYVQRMTQEPKLFTMEKEMPTRDLMQVVKYRKFNSAVI